MIVLTFMTILAPEAAFPDRAALLGVIAGTGLLTVGLWQRIGRYIGDYGLPRQHPRWTAHNIQPLLTAAIILGVALYRVPHNVQLIPILVAMTMIPLTLSAVAKPPDQLAASMTRFLQRLNPRTRSD